MDRSQGIGAQEQKDAKKAAERTRKAAEGGDPASMNNFGVFLITGYGVAQDATAGVAWLRKAAANGDKMG